jgi:hypothetical protein
MKRLLLRVQQTERKALLNEYAVCTYLKKMDFY